MDGIVVTVEADFSAGLPAFDMVGFLSSEVKEARERVKTAMKNSDFRLPPGRLVINMSPADVRKEGTALDAPLAGAVLMSIGMLPPKSLDDVMLAGELGLDGRLLPVNGVLAMACAAKEAGLKRFIVPLENASEGALVDDLRVYGVATLKEMIQLIDSEFKCAEPAAPKKEATPEPDNDDFADLCGQQTMRRAAQIAAAGRHNMLMIGPPGCGKSMLAKRIAGILPSMDVQESLQVTRIYSICGLLEPGSGLVTSRPFRAPHHTASPSALAGGGPYPKPGEVTLASSGVLFLDELPEFSSRALEVLRQPLEDKRIIISRAHGAYVFPADFLLIAAMNPCRCGYFPDRSRCHCTPQQINHYLGRISRPLLDRIDICVQAAPVDYKTLRQSEAEDTMTMRKRVEDAVLRQKLRFGGTDIPCNSKIPSIELDRYCRISEDGDEILKESFTRYGLSARACHKILRTARTIADLDDHDSISTEELCEAICYRSSEERIFGRA